MLNEEDLSRISNEEFTLSFSQYDYTTLLGIDSDVVRTYSIKCEWKDKDSCVTPIVLLVSKNKAVLRIPVSFFMKHLSVKEGKRFHRSYVPLFTIKEYLLQSKRHQLRFLISPTLIAVDTSLDLLLFKMKEY